MKIFFYVLIFALGTTTIITDIRQRKIKNLHLVFIATGALLSYVFFTARGLLPFSFGLLLNPALGLGLGFLLYRLRLWEAGDAKLFITYALLLPASKPHPMLPLPCLILFFVTFTLSFMLILPTLVYGIINNPHRVIKEFVSMKTLRYFLNILLIAFCLSWLLQPLINLFPLKNNIFISFVILFGGYLLLFKCVVTIKQPIILIAVLIAGLLLRYSFMPRFFSFSNIGRYFVSIFIYSVLFYILRLIISQKENNPARIPFSPFLFLGALLTNADIVWKITRLIYPNM